MMKNPIVLIHGYSDEGKSFKPWRDVLVAKGYRVEDVNICSYESLTNEVTIKDLAEGFDRALRIQAGLKDAEKFDAIVHSTGMLVIRSWLTTYNQRRERLNRLIGLAPANFGSPLAGMGRSFLGSFFKGRRELGPDFLEAGDKILDGLELGSRFTWELAHLDLLPTPERPNDTFYGKDESTPYVFIFCGMEPYTGLRQIVNKPGTDGTVRWAGCSLRTRKITVDLTRDLVRSGSEKRFSVLRGTNIDIPLVPVSGLNHRGFSQPHNSC
jgi:pimeloyl-ACP methyl ester carboxylesterase